MTHRRTRILALVLVIPGLAAATLAQSTPLPAPDAPPPTLEAKPARVDFAREGSTFVTLGGGAATDFSETLDSNLFVQYGSFVADTVEFIGELGALYSSQPGDDALGINPAFVIRWHAYVSPSTDTSFYLDAGIGILLSTSSIPAEEDVEGQTVDGTSFNFTPRLGVGATFRLDDSGTRLITGVRWHHISNARITGDDNNPARDGVMFYAGVMLPF